MDTNIYYIPEYQGISITNNFTEIQKRMDIGIDPKTEYIPIVISDFSKYEIKSLGFDKIDNDYFQSIKDEISKYHFEAIYFHKSSIDLLDVVLDVNHLIVGDKSKINLSEENFKNLEKITFLEGKSLKGKISGNFNSVKKIVLWHEGKKANTILKRFPDLKELHLFNGSEIELDLQENKQIERLQIGNFPKLEKILLSTSNSMKEVMVQNCKKLNIDNLPIKSISPPRKKENLSKIILTGNQDIDDLILDLKKNMEDYMNEYNPSYSQKEIDECVSLLIDFTIKIFSTKSKEEGMSIVKSTILKLNALNDKCEGSLIETNEREQICEIIILAGNEMGYNDIDEDITEEWREW